MENGEVNYLPFFSSLFLSFSLLFLDPIHGGTFNTINPATGEVITAVAAATAEDIDGNNLF